MKDILNSGNRDKLEIMAATLALTQKPTGITRIMTQLNLNYRMVTKYLRFMMEKGLIEKQRSATSSARTSHVYRATEKGLGLLKAYCEVLRSIYGEDFMQNKNNLAVVCIEYCKESESW